MAQPNYGFEKRRKDLARAKKQEEKRQRRLERSRRQKEGGQREAPAEEPSKS